MSSDTQLTLHQFYGELLQSITEFKSSLSVLTGSVDIDKSPIELASVNTINDSLIQLGAVATVAFKRGANDGR